jgi:hypothetical protein
MSARAEQRPLECYWLASVRCCLAWPVRLASSLAFTRLWAFILYVKQGKPPFAWNYLLFFCFGALAVSFLLSFNNVKQMNQAAASGLAVAVVNTGGFVGTAWLNSFVGQLLERVAVGPTYPLAAYRSAFSVFVVLGLLAVAAASLIKEQQTAVVGAGDA